MGKLDLIFPNFVDISERLLLAGSGRDRAAAIGRVAAGHTRAVKIHSGYNTTSQSIRCTFSMLKRP